MRVIAFSGWKKSGKDTAAEHLIAKGAFRTAFADALKNMASEEYDVPLEYFFNPELKEVPLLQYPVKITDNFIRGVCELLKDEFRTKTGKKPANLAIRLPIDVAGKFGNLVCADTGDQVYWTARCLSIFKGSGNRSVDGYYWNNRTAKEIKKSDASLVVVTDLRFKTEAEFLKKTFPDLLLIRINRFETVDSQDPSERDLDDYEGFDHIIKNDGSIEDLHKKIEELL